MIQIEELHPASFPQCRAIGYKFAKDAKTGKMNWLMQKRITAQMFDLAKQNKLSFEGTQNLEWQDFS